MIQVESRRTFSHGFVLTEAELRRIVESVSEQFQKLPDPKPPTIDYKMTFRNGVIADTDSLDEVLGQENSGSAQIVRLALRFANQMKKEDRAGGLPAIRTFIVPDTTVMLEFVDPDAEDEPRSVSVRFQIQGKSRDWVFVTSTILEERVTKVKRFALNQLLGRSSVVRLIGPMLVITVLMFTMILALKSSRGSAATPLEDAWKAGKLKDPVEAIIMAEKLRARAAAFPSSVLYMPFAVLLLFLVLLFLGASLTSKYFPTYNFCWGDYVESFRKKETVRKFILVVVILGVVISFVGSVLANFMHRN